MIEDPPGPHNHWSADYHGTFPDEALDIFMNYGFERQSPFAQQLVMRLGRRSRPIAEDTTPMTKRRDRR